MKVYLYAVLEVALYHLPVSPGVVLELQKSGENKRDERPGNPEAILWQWH